MAERTRRRVLVSGLGFGIALALGACSWRRPNPPTVLADGTVIQYGIITARRTVEIGETPPKQSYAWSVKIDGGSRTTVVQSTPFFAIGQRVRLLTRAGQTRLEIA